MGEQRYEIRGDVRAGRDIAFGDHNVFEGDRPSAQRGSAGEPRGGPLPAFGIVTALAEEFAAMRVLLDEARKPTPVAEDRAVYVRGTVPSQDDDRSHQVVLTLCDTGNSAAAEACANLIRSFPSVNTVIMCGIACGVPNSGTPERHVRLGDIVAATWGIADYDHVVETDDGRQPRQAFPLPSPLLVRRARYLSAVQIGGERPWERWIDVAEEALPACARPDDATDIVYDSTDPDRTLPHPGLAASGHRPGLPKVHHGRIGSADRSLRSAKVRDELAESQGIIAFEMEGKGIGSAGFAGGLEWFVVRGISDYGDMRTNRLWRGYASIVAAAYVRTLLAECPPLSPRGGHPQAAGGARLG